MPRTVQHGRGRPSVVATPPSRQQLAGGIWWLPPKDKLTGNDDPDLDEGKCNHPVVILSPQLENGQVVFLIVTSFKETSLEIRFSHHPSLRLEYLPIRPCDPHPDNGKLLSLSDPSLELRKKSYIHTKKTHQIRHKLLQTYDRRGVEYVLSRGSYLELIEYAGFSPPAPHPRSNTVSPGRSSRSRNRIIRASRPRTSFSASPPRVDSPVRTPAAATQRDSYSEFVSALRRLESGTTSPSRNQHHAHYVSATQWQPQPSERAPLLSRNNEHAYTYNRPYNTSHGVGYEHIEPSASPSGGVFWKCVKALFGIVGSLLGIYAVYRGAYWLAGMSKTSTTTDLHSFSRVVSDIWAHVTGKEEWQRLRTVEAKRRWLNRLLFGTRR
ncbi:hypothetical protein GGS23DRAFT_327218 [Durotheca rogersii]|uniref:uncharacterized protein n=1 Tax=Durotheca rogersii TaxID=419775 RepID=UPI00221E9CD9|nr:uncharacterized protein GGS23DRAFT_327218 [Durotheca rogersii]KAI5859260.1 hypothetical protein GGS23DRAFT_327218 [Durotheca rogersii]